MTTSKDDTRELLTPKITTAVEVAMLVKILPMQEAAELIEQYARTEAAGIRLDKTIHAKFRRNQEED